MADFTMCPWNAKLETTCYVTYRCGAHTVCYTFPFRGLEPATSLRPVLWTIGHTCSIICRCLSSSTDTNLCQLATEVQRCEQLAQSCYAKVPDRKSNLRPLHLTSDTVPLRHHATRIVMMMMIVDLYKALRRAAVLRYMSRCIVKRNVFSADRKDLMLSDVSRRWSGSRFQTIGPTTENARRPNLLRRWRGAISWWRVAERRHILCI